MPIATKADLLTTALNDLQKALTSTHQQEPLSTLPPTEHQQLESLTEVFTNSTNEAAPETTQPSLPPPPAIPLNTASTVTPPTDATPEPRPQPAVPPESPPNKPSQPTPSNPENTLWKEPRQVRRNHAKKHDKKCPGQRSLPSTPRHL